MAQPRTPAQVLSEARRQSSLDKRTRTIGAVQGLLRRGEPVTFAAVARAAQVSTWLVYAEGVREHIEAARQRQSAPPNPDESDGRVPQPSRTEDGSGTGPTGDRHAQDRA